MFASSLLVCSYVDEIRRKNSSQLEDGLFYAGHPVNAYNLIKRWYSLAANTPNTDTYKGASLQAEACVARVSMQTYIAHFVIASLYKSQIFGVSAIFRPVARLFMIAVYFSTYYNGH